MLKPRRPGLWIKLLAFIVLLLGGNHCVKADETTFPFQNAALPIDQRVADLLGRMTETEKIGQLNCAMGWPMFQRHGETVGPSEAFKQLVAAGRAGALWGLQRADPWTKMTLANGLPPRLAAEAANALQRYVLEHSRLPIPMLLAEECPHGHMAIGATVFPTAIGQASTWNPSLIGDMASAIAVETRCCGANIGYGPVLDLAREPRWSRVEETYGEDPFLVSQMGVAMVRGFQGGGLQSDRAIISTLKHFAAHGVPEGGHNAGMANVGPRELASSLLPPVHAAVIAGAGSVMSSYNEIDGVPCSSNEQLLTDILRRQWGFDGFVVSDLYAIKGLMTGQHVAVNVSQAAAMAITAGVDLDLGAEAYGDDLQQAIKDGLVSGEVLDRAVSRVLAAKFSLGLFEHPYVDAKTPQTVVRSAAHRDLARQVARESIILLKNDGALLPLKKNIASIAVIGPNADSVYNQLGDYTAPQPAGAVMTVLDGIRQIVSPKTKVIYARGCGIRDASRSGFSEALAAVRQSDVAVVVLGGSSARDFDTLYEGTGAANPSLRASGGEMEAGEGFDRSTLDLLGEQLPLLQQIVEIGKPVVLVLIQGRPLNLNWSAAHVPAIVCGWYPGEQGGGAIADVLFGDFNPAGRLPISVPCSVGQLPDYYNAKPDSRRDYVEGPSTPHYEFGYGLSYTHFNYSKPQCSVTEMKNQVSVQISFAVTNTGGAAGDEVAQLYLRDDVSSVTTPVRALKAFHRIHLKPGESQTVQFELNAGDLALLDRHMRWVVEPGTFQAMIGASSSDIRQQLSFTVSQPIHLEEVLSTHTSKP